MLVLTWLTEVARGQSPFWLSYQKPGIYEAEFAQGKRKRQVIGVFEVEITVEICTRPAGKFSLELKSDCDLYPTS